MLHLICHKLLPSEENNLNTSYHGFNQMKIFCNKMYSKYLRKKSTTQKKLGFQVPTYFRPIPNQALQALLCQ